MLRQCARGSRSTRRSRRATAPVPTRWASATIARPRKQEARVPEQRRSRPAGSRPSVCRISLTGRPRPAFDGIFQSQPTASSVYHGVTALLNRRLANELEWSAAYTWSHATDTASDFDEQRENPYDLGAESADSRFDHDTASWPAPCSICRLVKKKIGNPATCPVSGRACLATSKWPRSSRSIQVVRSTRSQEPTTRATARTH